MDTPHRMHDLLSRASGWSHRTHKLIAGRPHLDDGITGTSRESNYYKDKDSLERAARVLTFRRKLHGNDSEEMI